MFVLQHVIMLQYMYLYVYVAQYNQHIVYDTILLTIWILQTCTISQFDRAYTMPISATVPVVVSSGNNAGFLWAIDLESCCGWRHSAQHWFEYHISSHTRIRHGCVFVVCVSVLLVCPMLQANKHAAAIKGSTPNRTIRCSQVVVAVSFDHLRWGCASV